MFGLGGDGQEIRTQRSDFRQIAEVRAYWEAKRRPGHLPRRDDIDPRGMASALERVFLIEQVAPNHARLRLAGMHLCDLLGMEVRGMPITAFLEPQARSQLSEVLAGLFRGEYVLDLWLAAERGIGRPALDARMMLMPLIGSYGEPAMALGCLCTNGELGRAPRRFAISHLLRETLPEVPKPQTHFAEAASAFAASEVHRIPRGRPNLRLVSSRD